MARFVQFPTIDGGTILVEAAGGEEDLPADGVVRAGLTEKVHHTVLQARETFEQAVMDTVRRNADAFVRTMRTLAEPPSEAELAFGVKVTGEAGYSAVAKGGAESTYTVTLTWKRDKEEKDSE